MVRRIAVLLVALAALTGCSRTELIYRNADWLAYRWTDGLLDAGAAQQDDWRQLFERVHDTHRRELLPRVVVLLDQLSRQARQQMSVTRLDCLLQSADPLIDAHAHLLVDAAVDVLDGVSAAQVAHLQEALAERNAEYREDYLRDDPVARHDARVERYIERIERWTGELDTAQSRLVDSAVRAMPDTAASWLDYRERQQARLLALLRADADDERLRAFLSAWWVERADRDLRLVEDGVRLRDGWLRLLVELDGTLDAGQREFLVARVEDLRDDLAGELVGGIGLAALPTQAASCAQRL